VSRSKFRPVSRTRIRPSEDRLRIAVRDATPELIRAYALDDEQALLAIVRYNRLIDTFLGLTTYSLQNHLRTTVKGIGQIEIDELYKSVSTSTAAITSSRCRPKAARTRSASFRLRKT